MVDVHHHVLMPNFGRKQGLKYHPQVRQHSKDLMPNLMKIKPHCRLCMSSREASHTTKASKSQAP